MKDDYKLNDLLQKCDTFSRRTEESKSLTKEIKKRVRELKNKKYQQEAGEKNEYSNRKQVEKLYIDLNSTFKEVEKKRQCNPVEL